MPLSNTPTVHPTSETPMQPHQKPVCKSRALETPWPAIRCQMFAMLFRVAYSQPRNIFAGSTSPLATYCPPRRLRQRLCRSTSPQHRHAWYFVSHDNARYKWLDEHLMPVSYQDLSSELNFCSLGLHRGHQSHPSNFRRFQSSAVASASEICLEVNCDAIAAMFSAALESPPEVASVAQMYARMLLTATPSPWA